MAAQASAGTGDGPDQETAETQRSKLAASVMDYPWRGYVEELLQAAGRGRASFAQTFMAMYIIDSDNTAGTAARLELLSVYGKLVESFQRSQGTVVESRYGISAAAGAVLLGIPGTPAAGDAQGRDQKRPGPASRVQRWMQGSDAGYATDGPYAALAADFDAFVFWKWLHFDSPDAMQLLADLLSLRDRITTFLPGDDPSERGARDISLRRLYGIASEMIESIDAEEGRVREDNRIAFYSSSVLAGTYRAERSSGATTPPPDFPQTDELKAEFENYHQQHNEERPSQRFVSGTESLRARLAKDEAVYLAAMQRTAQHTYVRGMFLGAAILAIPLIAVAIVTGVIGLDAAWLAAAVGGAVGAVLSVLQRLGRGLELGPEGERNSFWQQGVDRPVIGMVLGIASFVLLRGGLVSLTAVPAGAERALYYAGIAFFAGFSERFAQDMLGAPPKVAAAKVTTPRADAGRTSPEG